MKAEPIQISTAKLATLSRYLSPKLFDIWRTLVLIFSVQMFVCNFIIYEKVWYLKIRYLTTWGYSLHTVAFGLLFILQKLGVNTNNNDSSTFATKIWSFTILVYEIAFSMAFPITIVYWLAIWPSDKIENAYDHFLNI